ncbi:MAG TPA: TetR/AcrR family transcriptional regulator [Candidatus Limnocylindrales bacterium]|nr:TetR/AcrR family transcriptional regulator [Candidatus Limnocylindrales bacterium]
MSMTDATTDGGRRQRSDGERSRRAILATATRLASTRGLDRLSIGDLADEVGMSKSGLYAHFGSKEELQLATIDAAEEIFDRVVVAPSEEAEPGLPAVLALCDAFLDHLRDKVFPGGCFFACASAEMHMQPGPVKDRIAEFDARWQARFLRNLEAARAAGEIAADADVDALVFDLDALLYYAHGAFSFRDDPGVLHQARLSVRERLRRSGGTEPRA